MANNLKLSKATLVALRDYMGVSQDETLLILTDENLREIGMALYETGKQLAHEVFYVEMKPREVNGQEPPEQIADLMKTVDVVVCPTTRSITHTLARREASKLGVRIGTMPGVTVETIIRCFSADHKKIIDTTEFIARKLEKVTYVHIVSRAGTNITLPVKNRRIIRSTGVLRKIGESGNIPSGEVYLAPWEKQTNGVIVFDASIAGIGLLQSPVTVNIKNGYIENITGDKDAERLDIMLRTAGRDALAVGEFGIGTNYKAKLCGDILEDEKVLGTVHIAFGNNMTMGGRISVQSHVDGLISKPTVFFDDEIVMENGKLFEK